LGRLMRCVGWWSWRDERAQRDGISRPHVEPMRAPDPGDMPEPETSQCQRGRAKDGLIGYFEDTGRARAGTLAPRRRNAGIGTAASNRSAYQPVIGFTLRRTGCLYAARHTLRGEGADCRVSPIAVCHYQVLQEEDCLSSDQPKNANRML